MVIEHAIWLHDRNGNREKNAGSILQFRSLMMGCIKISSGYLGLTDKEKTEIWATSPGTAVEKG